MSGTGGTGTAYAVLDTNVVAAWSYSEPNTVLAKRVLASLVAGDLEAWVPELFWAEFQQVGMKKMSGGVGRADVEAAYLGAEAIGLKEMPVLECLRADAWQLILDYSLGSYDAYFLALAMELGIDLWTFDNVSLCARLPVALRRHVVLLGADPFPI